MAKRFGRNQRRKMLEKVNYLQRWNATYQQTNVNLYRQLEQCQREKFQHFLVETGRLDLLMNKLVEELALKLGKELAPHAQRLLELTNHKGPLLSFEAYEDQGLQAVQKPVTVIRGRIAPFTYNIALV